MLYAPFLYSDSLLVRVAQKNTRRQVEALKAAPRPVIQFDPAHPGRALGHDYERRQYELAHNMINGRYR